MNWLDLGIVIFVIIFIVIGIKQGLMTSVLSHFSLAVNCLISVFFHKPIAFIYNKLFKIGPDIADHYLAKFSNTTYMTQNLMEVSEENLSSVVNLAINEGEFGFIPKTMFKVFVNKKTLYETLHSSGHTSRTVADIVAQTYSSFFVTIIAFVTSLIILFAVVWAFRKGAEKLRTVGFVKGVDNTFGAIYGVFKCFMVLVILCCIIKLLSPFGFMQAPINYINDSFFGSFLYNQINELVNNYLSFSDIISSIFH